MKEVKPQVGLIAHTTIDRSQIAKYLESIGASDYVENELRSGELSDGAELVRFAGKLCYNSFAPGLNPNVSKVTEGGAAYLNRILKQAHGSILEHVTGTFIISNVSRVFTHELVRHRVGVAYSQESLRYCRLTELKFWMPTILKDQSERVRDLIWLAIKSMEENQVDLADFTDIEGLKFSEKKALTSAFRRIAPMGLATNIVVTMNVRTLRHVILMRTSRHAEEEIRIVFNDIAIICKETWPELFADFTIASYTKDMEIVTDDPPEWQCKNSQQPYGG